MINKAYRDKTVLPAGSHFLIEILKNKDDELAYSSEHNTAACYNCTMK